MTNQPPKKPPASKTVILSDLPRRSTKDGRTLPPEVIRRPQRGPFDGGDFSADVTRSFDDIQTLRSRGPVKPPVKSGDEGG